MADWINFKAKCVGVLINVDMKISVLKGERFEVNPEEITVTFDDVKGVCRQNFSTSSVIYLFVFC